MSYRVVIPTAGIGSRLGNLTKYINKSLVSIANRPVLCHLIEQFPEDCEFVIALGYKGHLVREFVELAYPCRAFIFSEVDPYIGKGSGLGYSLMCCKQYLQQPFIFISCDTLVKEKIPSPSVDWIGYSQGDDIESYRTVSIKDDNIQAILEKGKRNSNKLYPYIGVAGIHNYIEFWSAMHQNNNIAIQQGEAYGLRCLLDKHNLKARLFTWYDTGTVVGLERTRLVYSQTNEPNILEKENEAIWFINDNVIKYSDDKRFIANRVIRSSKLSSYVPKITDYREHMYSYKKVEGEVLSKIITLPLFKQFLEYCKEFWEIAPTSQSKISIFESNCREFYESKTITRVETFYQNFSKNDRCETINGDPMPLLSTLLKRIDWKNISKGLPGRYHGDFHFENIIWNPKSSSFTFLDWRQDFAGDLEIGDIYYDLAKLLHGLIVSHDLITANAFNIKWTSDEITFNLHRHYVHVECEQYLSIWCHENNFDYSKVRLLTALIYLNIAALHHYPYSLLLYTLGKKMLHQEVEK